jgi:hypothetical protein
MPADIGGKSPLRDGSNEESILAENKQTSSLIQFKACAPALPGRLDLGNCSRALTTAAAWA